MGPSPFRRHQDIVGNLYAIIRQHIKLKNLGEIYLSPLDVIFEEGINRLQPDILFVKKNNQNILQDWIRGVPDMVCEIISQGSYEMDTEVKKAIYEKYRVPEYWIVMPELQMIEILTIEGDKYKLHCVASFEGMVTSKVIEGLTVNIKDIFE
ncbi:Uma2 family endonuclease [Candidatus Magnetomonas plexicatena]|nr:Uma2 family endonuclease [Nitrospirales bacterium LBB_01]